MTTDSFKLTVITPAGVALEQQVTAVTLPSSDGEIGVLPQHVPYNGILGVGILSYTPVGEHQPRRIVTAGGFCQFAHGTLKILADTVDLPDDVNRDTYGNGRATLQSTVDSGDTASLEWQAAKEQLARIEAIDRLIEA